MNRLKELRLEKGLLQSDVAKIIGKTDRAVGLYERGERDIATDVLAKLSDFFNCSIDYLLGKTDIRKNEKQDTLGLAKIGFNMDNYNPPTEKQKEQIRDLLELILKDNKRKDK